MRLLIRRFLTLSWVFLAVATALANEPDGVRVETIVSGLDNPWAMAFVAPKQILITERGGALRSVVDGKLQTDPIDGLPTIREKGQGGLMGIALHPNFAENRWIYLSYAGRGKGGYSTEMLRAKLEGGSLHELEILFRAQPKVGGGRHFGGRLLFDDAGYLFLSLGDRGRQDDAQDTRLHSGSLIRLHDDGRIPQDNPFTDDPAIAEGIYTIGNRNMQGMALHPQTREVWTHEHGPQGGDEINIMRAGHNYGWPVITYGRNYGIGTKIGEGTHNSGMRQPVHKWVPSIAPSGMAFYTGPKYPVWQDDLFVGSLKFGLLVRLELDGEKILNEHRLLDGGYGRIRDVAQSPEGDLYVLTDESKGRLLRVSPD